MAITREHVLQALSTVPVDAKGTGLVASGRLSDVVVDDAGRVMFSITIDPSEAADMERVRQAAVTAVQGLPSVTGVFASLTADRPQDPRGALPRPRQRSGPGQRLSRRTSASPACTCDRRRLRQRRRRQVDHRRNLALGLKALAEVGLLDADIYGPSMPKLLGIHGKPRLLENRILEPMEAYGLKVMSIGFLVEEEAAMIWRGPMVMSAITQMLREVAWGDLDVLVVDMPLGTGDAQSPWLRPRRSPARSSSRRPRISR